MDLVELVPLIPSLIVDMRYASTQNITGKVLYQPADAIPRLEKAAAQRLIVAANILAAENLRLVFWDGYRTLAAQAELRAVNNDSNYVSDDSNHCRGVAVDVTVADTEGNYLDMGSDFDEFSPRAHVDADNLSAQQVANRAILRQAMEAAGFTQWPFEWWHYDLKQ